MSTSEITTALNLAESPVHLDAIDDSESPAVVLENFAFDGAAFEQYIGKHCAKGPGRLVMIETTASDWSHWECHTEGEEIVVVLEGEGVMVQQLEGEEVHIPVQAGMAVVNPRNVWHTANVTQPLKALYITPCRGTEHKAR